MGQLKQTGTFLFDIVEACICATKNGLPQWVANLKAVQAYDDESGQWVDYSQYEDNEILAYLVLFGKDGKSLLNAKQLQKAIGWNGTSFEELDQMDYSGIQIQARLEEHEYEGKTSIRVQWIDHKDADPTRVLQRLDSDALKKLNAKFASGMRELSGGPKPKSVPVVPPTPPVAPPIIPPPANPVTQVDPKAEAKAKYEDKKKRGKAAEAKAQVTETKQTPPKPQMPPIPPKPKAIGIEKYNLSPTCTQEEAWEACAKHRKTDMSDDDLGNIWLQIIGDIGGDEVVGEDWYKVRDGVLEIVGQ